MGEGSVRACEILGPLIVFRLLILVCFTYPDTVWQVIIERFKSTAAIAILIELI